MSLDGEETGEHELALPLAACPIEGVRGNEGTTARIFDKEGGMEEMQEKYKKAFDGYLKLQAETYELVLRNVTMHKRLSEAYELLREKPEMSAEEIYSSSKDKFEEIYQELFTMFFRPFKVLVQPYSEILKVHSEAFTPQLWFERYMDFFRMWGEAQSSYLKGMVNVYQGYSKELQGEGTEKKDLSAQMRELRPVDLLRNMCDEGSKVYFETMVKNIEHFGENQFLFPKTLFIHLRDGVSSYSKMYGLWRSYESMLHDRWRKSLGKFIDVMVKSGKSPSEIEYEEFYGMFINTFTEEYGELLKSSEFVEAQNDALSGLADVSYNFQKAMEAQLDMFPALPFAPRSEIDTIEKRMYDYSREVREVKKEIWGIKDLLRMTPTSAELSKSEERVRGEELAELRKRVEGVEKEIKRLRKKAVKEAGE